MTFLKRSAVVQATTRLCKCSHPAMSHAYLPMMEGNVGKCLSRKCECVGFRKATMGEIAAMGLDKKPEEAE